MDDKVDVFALIGEMYPPAVSIGTKIRRNWIARTVGSLPDQTILAKMQRTVEEECFAAMERAYAASVTAEQLTEVRPSVILIKLDELHLLIQTDYAGPDKNIGDVDMIAQWGVLQAIDQRIEFEDLQGLPWSFWFPLRKAREARQGK